MLFILFFHHLKLLFKNLHLSIKFNGNLCLSVDFKHPNIYYYNIVVLHILL